MDSIFIKITINVIEIIFGVTLNWKQVENSILDNTEF